MLREQSAINPTLPLTAMGASSWEIPTIIESCREHHSCPQTRCKKTHRVMCDACRACVCIAADHHAHAHARASRQESASFYARTHARTTRIALHMMSMFISELINSFDNHFARRWVRCEVRCEVRCGWALVGVWVRCGEGVWVGRMGQMVRGQSESHQEKT